MYRWGWALYNNKLYLIGLVFLELMGVVLVFNSDNIKSLVVYTEV